MAESVLNSLLRSGDLIRREASLALSPVVDPRIPILKCILQFWPGEMARWLKCLPWKGED